MAFPTANMCEFIGPAGSQSHPSASTHHSIPSAIGHYHPPRALGNRLGELPPSRNRGVADIYLHLVPKAGGRGLAGQAFITAASWNIPTYSHRQQQRSDG